MAVAADVCPGIRRAAAGALLKKRSDAKCA